MMRGMWLTIGIGATLIGGICLGSALIVGRLFAPSRVVISARTYREAVMQVLDQHAVPYADIRVSDSCPPMPQCREVGTGVDSTYTAEVVVDKAQPTTYGWIVCRHRRTDCVLTLAGLGLHSIPLAPLAQQQLWPEALKRPILAMEAWLRAWTAHLRHS
jgi:hypothetical protein